MSDLIRAASEALHRAADETNDQHDHDELHAAGHILDLIHRGAFMPDADSYIGRWLRALAVRVGSPVMTLDTIPGPRAPRTMQEIIDTQDELADRFEKLGEGE